MNTYALYGNGNQPMVDDKGKELVLTLNGEPQNGDELTLNNKTYTVRRVWREDGQLIIKLRATGLVLTQGEKR